MQDLKAQIAAHNSQRTPEDAAAWGELKRFVAANRAAARTEALKEKGLDAPMLSEAQLLAIAPDVDPREPEGAAALEAWRKENSHLFRPPEDPKRKALETALRADQRLAANPFFSVERAMRSYGRRAT